MHYYIKTCGQDPKTCKWQRDENHRCTDNILNCLKYEDLLSDYVMDKVEDSKIGMLKKLAIVAASFIILSSPIQATAGMADDEWTGQDKTAYALIGGGIGAVITSHFMINGKMVRWYGGKPH